MPNSYPNDRVKMRVRARAVDMLGRQQIAGIPTAIHELFKNAHDAYADRVEVDYSRVRNMLILRDDGIGMTRADFEGKWLTLGTESKVGANARKVGFIPDDKEVRPIMGEKGIGRLAIATIGRQVLILTRAIREDGLHDLTMALIHWKLFEIPGIDLDDIVIPIKDLKGGTLPTKEDINELVNIIKSNLNELSGLVSSEDTQIILDDLNLFNFGIATVEKALPGLSLIGEGHGTQFFVYPTDKILQKDIDDEPLNGGASNIQKVLLGFSNTMYDESKARVKVAFRDHKLGEVVDLLEQEEFFNPKEFALADHHIEGEFNEYGQFNGTVSIYHKFVKEHFLTWQNNGKKTECGAFKIKFAYLQGDIKQSVIPSEQHAILYQKCNKIGGLYIYRDGIRMLPYGDADYDWLGLEKQRSKSAQDAFFTFRRMFGAIEISYITNPNLVEKAGREGFRENNAFRQLRDLLIVFFKSLVREFFHPDSEDQDFVETKNQLHKNALALQKRANQTKAKKNTFAKELGGFFDKLETAYFVKQVSDIRGFIDKRADSLLEEPSETLKLEREIKEKLNKLRNELTVVRPKGLGLTKTLLADWEAYQKNKIKLEQEIIKPLEVYITSRMANLFDRINGIDKRQQIDNQLEAEKQVVKKRSNELKRSVDTQLDLFKTELQNTLKDKIKTVNKTVEQALIDFRGSDEPIDVLMEKQQQWEKHIDVTLNETDEYLSALRDRLVDLTATIQKGESLDSDLLEAVETQNEELKDQLESYFEFAQVGMSLGIVQHEFSATIRHVRESVKQLKPWADKNSALNPLYQNIRHNFEHLDGFLNLFTPLNRRLYRKQKEMVGYEIFQYIQNIFRERLVRHHIELIHTQQFDAKKIITYPSTILPVFVNLVDNAIYWINSDKDCEHYIKLDAGEDGFLVSNGGPGIENKDEKRIFEFGISRKPGGRGMGLYISKTSLNRESFDLELLTLGKNTHPTFYIKQIKEEK